MIVVGTSGWQYDEWKPVLYPGVPKARWLEHFATSFPACEVNNTFYRLPSAETFASWRARTPEGFVFAVKASRTITHLRRLHETGEAVTALVEHASALGPKLGPILYQCPPSLHRDDALLERFLDALPPYPRAAMEFRHASWFDPAVDALLAKRDVARCCTEAAHAQPTASFAYLRLHGGPQYSRYSDEESIAWAERVAAMAAAGTDPIFVFFDNDVAGNAVHDARALRERCANLGLPVARPEKMPGPLF